MSTISGTESWEDVELPDDGDPANQATFEAGYQHLANRDEFMMRNAALAIANAETIHAATSERYRAVCYGVGAGPANNGMWVACGDSDGSQAIVSLSLRDGLWINYTTSGGLLDTYGAEFYGVAHGGTGALGSRVFVFVGKTKLTTVRPAIWVVADDAEEDTNVTIPKFENISLAVQETLNSDLGDTFWAVAWTGSVFCVVGDNGIIMTSANGSTSWTYRTADDAYVGSFRNVKWLGGTTVIAVGVSGEIQRSTDGGLTWAQVFSNVTYGTLGSIAQSGSSIIVSTTATNSILRSTDDGATWAAVELTPSGSIGASFVFSFRGLMACRVYESGVSSVARFLISYNDGLTWPTEFRGTAAWSSELNGAAAFDRLMLVGLRYAGSAGVTVSNSGCIWQTPILPMDV